MFLILLLWGLAMSTGLLLLYGLFFGLRVWPGEERRYNREVSLILGTIVFALSFLLGLLTVYV